MRIINELKWRYATKKFDPNKKISEENLSILQEAIRLSASSYGLQPYKVLIVEDVNKRAQLLEHSAGQQQVVDASHLFVFCGMTAISEEYIKRFLLLKAKVQNLDEERALNGLKGIKASIDKRSSESLKAWTSKQTYIAMSNLLTACAELKIDACPMEGFSPSGYDQVLGLSQLELEACTVVPVGYRSEEDTYQHKAKVRIPESELFTTI